MVFNRLFLLLLLLYYIILYYIIIIIIIFFRLIYEGHKCPWKEKENNYCFSFSARRKQNWLINDKKQFSARYYQDCNWTFQRFPFRPGSLQDLWPWRMGWDLEMSVDMEW